MTTESAAEPKPANTRQPGGLSDEGEIIVVSGLPRSGTSLLMQILEAAGVPLLIDGARRPDESNPRGYFELEAVTRIRDDVSFLRGAHGKAVKVVAPLLPFLPAEYDYAVILAERNLREVMESQRAMLERTGAALPGRDSGVRADPGAPGAPIEPPGDNALEAAFTTQIARAHAWGKRHRNVRVHPVLHADLIANPEAAVRGIFDFLPIVPEESKGRASAAVVDRSLYRERES